MYDPTQADGPDAVLAGLAAERVMPSKIAPPSPRVARALTIPRPRLVERVREGVDRAALTLLVAPAGAGKSTVVADWARERPAGTVAWVRFDAGDDERRRFWRLVVAALEAVGIVEPGQHIVPTGRYDVDDLLPSLVTALDRRSEPALLVMEDIQEIGDPEIIADMERLMRVPPRFLRVVVTTRSAPRIRLQRLRLAQQVVMIDARDLAFTRAEARQLADEAGARIEDEDLEQLWRRTEGWAAGLGLAVRAVVDAPDPGAYIAGLVGTEAPLADYLVEEVLSYVPRATIDFMLQTCIVDPVTGALADAITGGRGGGATLDDLERRGMLVSAADDRRESFRYHPLLRGYLAGRLRREAAGDEAELHRRASAWLAEHGSDVPAIRHAIRGQDWDRLYRLVSSRWLICAMEGDLASLGRALRLAPHRIQMTPFLAVPFAMQALDAGHLPEADEWLSIARAGRDRLSPTGRLGLSVAELHRYRMVGDKAQAQQAILDGRAIDVEAIEQDAEPGTRLRYIAVCAVGKLELGIIELWTGEPGEAAVHLHEAIDQASTTGVSFLEHLGLAYLGFLQLFTGDLSAALTYARAAEALAEERDWPLTEGAPVVRSVLGHVAFFAGRLQEAETHLLAARQLTARSPDLPLRAYTQLQLGRLRLAQGNPQDALALLDAAERSVEGTAFASTIAPLADVLRARALDLLGRGEEVQPPRDRNPGDADVVVLRARQALAREDPGGADALVAAWRDAGEAAVHPTMRILALLLQAQARSEQGGDADEPLERALEHAQESGTRLPFLEAGAPIAALLARYPGTRAQAPLAREILAMTHGAVPGPDDDPTAATEPAERLTEKEMAVLRFLPTSLTNREIATELILSVNTVKTHVRQAYAKLGAHDRREAVQRARQLGLIPPGAGGSSYGPPIDASGTRGALVRGD